MSAIDHSRETAFRPADAGRAVGVMANLERFGREVVWVMIAAAFCLVEAAVFLTDLPIAKFLARRSNRR
jgi:hypothetical protein